MRDAVVRGRWRSRLPAFRMGPEAGIEPVRYHLVGVDVVMVNARALRRFRRRQHKSEGAKGRVVQWAIGRRDEQKTQGDIETYPADQVLGLLRIQSVQRIDPQRQRAGPLGWAVVVRVLRRPGQDVACQLKGRGIECAYA